MLSVVIEGKSISRKTTKSKSKKSSRNDAIDALLDAVDSDEDDALDNQYMDSDVWEMKKGSMHVSSSMPYEGDLNGDEDGDF